MPVLGCRACAAVGVCAVARRSFAVFVRLAMSDWDDAVDRTDDVKQFAINVLNIFDVPESEWRA
jgi:hypothetical protein